MSTVIPLELIDPNPYQTRLSEDPAHIVGLAENIKANGMLQTPLARPAGKRYQLAFGHSRLSAWRIAFPTEPFPLEVRELTDRQMSDNAASENAHRKDLSAIETAMAIQRRIADFKLNQMEAAKPFGYTSQGGVSNLLRLLKLPEHSRELVHTGTVPERIARLLLPVARMSLADVDKIADVVAKADPSDRDEMAEREVGHFLSKQGRPLSWQTPFKQEWPAKPIAVNGELTKGIGGAPAEVPACKSCEFRIEIGRGNAYCTRPPCYEVKTRLHFQAELKRASQESGIAIAGPDEKLCVIYDGSGYDQSALRRATRLARSKSDILRLSLIDVGKKATGESYLEGVTGSRFVMLLATNKAEADRIMATFSGQKAREMAQSNETEARKAKRIEREEAQREEGRAQRSKEYRARADINWLIATAGAWLGKQLDATGGALEFLATEVERQYWKRGNTSEFDAAAVEYRKRLDSVAGKSQGKAREVILRERIVVDVIAHELAEGYGVTPPPWFNWSRALTIVARVTEKDFKAKLPAGWNEPPIHQSPTNCRQCGKFGSNAERITKGELAAGWFNGGEAGVFCGDAHLKQYQAAQAKGVATPAAKTKTKKK